MDVVLSSICFPTGILMRSLTRFICYPGSVSGSDELCDMQVSLSSMGPEDR